jgi:uncharacterized protein
MILGLILCSCITLFCVGMLRVIGPALDPDYKRNDRTARIMRGITQDFVIENNTYNTATSPSSRERGWMQTCSGRKFYPLEPKYTEVALVDIAHGLAMTCRYGGHTSRFYSVAEHCVLVSQTVEIHARNAGHDEKTVRAWAREALLHDSAETYIGDMIRPLKHQPEMHEFRRCEAAIEVAVFEHFGIASTEDSRAAVKSIDDRILVDEIVHFMPNPMMYLDAGLDKLSALSVTFYGWNPAEAEEGFMFRFNELWS